MNVMGTSTGRRHEHSHSPNRFAVHPTEVRLGISDERGARGITIAFLDSGFYPHPDLTEPTNRIARFVDITDPEAVLDDRKRPDDWYWHGTMTSVAAAGNGKLSEGFYRGLAFEASVVLVKVSDRGRITEENIEHGLRWVIANKDRYNIRVLNISLGGDAEVSYLRNSVDQAAEDAVRAGIIVVVAAGNSGCTDLHKTVPPANSPSVITVGGYDDKNQLNGDLDLYCSSYGETVDRIVKPEIIAPAMWVAAPILPGTHAYEKAAALSRIASCPDYAIRDMARIATGAGENGLWREAGLPEWLRGAGVEAIRTEINRLLEENKIIASHYQHVDGTSFAAPIVASIAARMLEINPNLSPAAVKHILISTANRISGASVIRQGYGMVNAKLALAAAQTESHIDAHSFFCPPRVIDGRLEFSFHDDSASSVSLAGDFNGWDYTRSVFGKDQDNVWRVRLENVPRGIQRYKLVLDSSRWIEDPSNLQKEPDGYGGFNSIVKID